MKRSGFSLIQNSCSTNCPLVLFSFSGPSDLISIAVMTATCWTELFQVKPDLDLEGKRSLCIRSRSERRTLGYLISEKLSIKLVAILYLYACAGKRKIKRDVAKLNNRVNIFSRYLHN